MKLRIEVDVDNIVETLDNWLENHGMVLRPLSTWAKERLVRRVIEAAFSFSEDPPGDGAGLFDVFDPDTFATIFEEYLEEA